TLIRQKLVPQRLEGEAGQRSLWIISEAPVTEGGPVSSDHGTPEVWRVINPNLTNPLGRHPGYELRLGHSATSLLAPDDLSQRRSGSPLTTRASCTPPARTRTRATAATASLPMPPRGAQSKTPTSCCGTRWASTTCRAPRTGLSCRPCGTACRSSPTASSTITPASTHT